MTRRGSVCVLAALLLTAVATTAAEPTRTLDPDGVRLELVLVKKGTFQQGSPAREVGRGDDETPRQVTLTQDFYLGKYPVTRGQFARFTRETGYRTEAERGPSGGFGFDGRDFVQRKEFTWRNPGFEQTDDHPVCLVTFDDAQAFAAWLGKKTKQTVVLPTEGQWEYACRAGSVTRFGTGDADEDARACAWFKANAGDGTRSVGRKKPNAFGLYDMAGNVYEWCRDWYGPYAPGPVEDPEETRADRSNPPRRILRGGSWFREIRHCRSAARYRSTPGTRNAEIGFRVLVAAPAPAREEGTGRPTARATQAAGFVPPVFAASEIGMFLCVFAIVFLMVVGVLLKRVLSPPQFRDVPPRPDGQRPRVVTDGFWVPVRRMTPGSQVRYRYRGTSGPRTGTFRVEPGLGEYFVYTGETPDDVEILDVVPPGGRAVPSPVDEDDDSGPTTGGTWSGTAAPPTPSPPAAEPFGGYPSAY
jgi:formylglycine-generating enzyme required for sulfatase activity